MKDKHSEEVSYLNFWVLVTNWESMPHEEKAQNLRAILKYFDQLDVLRQCEAEARERVERASATGHYPPGLFDNYAQLVLFHLFTTTYQVCTLVPSPPAGLGLLYSL